MCLLVRLLVLQGFFLDIAGCFSASKSNAKSPSEESIFSYWLKEYIESTCIFVSTGRTGDSVSKRYTFHPITVRRQRP